jgi:hypothetical protein
VSNPEVVFALYVCVNPTCTEVDIPKSDTVSGLQGGPTLVDVICGGCGQRCERRPVAS